MALDPEDLAVFLVVVREKSFGRAARSLLVSQPTVSERIARMERTIGADVFVRGPRGVSLTPSGERLRPVAERIVGLMVEAVETARSSDQPPPLQVGVHSTFAYRAVPLVVPRSNSRPGASESETLTPTRSSPCCSTGCSTPGSFSLAHGRPDCASTPFQWTQSCACALLRTSWLRRDPYRCARWRSTT